MKIALVYDHVNKIGGAERILSNLHELFPDAPIFTTVYNQKKAFWVKDIRIIPSFMQRLPFATRFHELYPGIPILAFENLNFNKYDIVISITSAEAKGIITNPNTLHICYCLTPTRYLWSQYHDYFPNAWFSVITLPVIAIIRQWDTIASNRPDIYLAISKTVANRIKKYYHKKAEVIYPPVETNKFQPNTSSDGDNEKDFYLVVSRLVSYKHIEIAIEACKILNRRLKIVGTGLESRKLKKISGPTVEFLGNLTDRALVLYYQRCRALIFPQEEDFGISAVEALACGKPVIAYAKGGIREIIVEGVTGEFFYTQSIEALTGSIKKFERKLYNSNSCRKQAQLFSSKRFKHEFNNFVNKEWEKFNLTRNI